MGQKKGEYVKFRKPISKYPKTAHQKKIALSGKRIAEECTGKKGKAFTTCRLNVLSEIFDEH